MDVICLVRQNKAVQQPQVEAVGMGAYLLIRIDLNVEKNEWFGLSMERPSGALGEVHPKMPVEGNRSPRFWRRKKRKKRMPWSDMDQECVEELQDYYRHLALVREGIAGLGKEILALPEPDSNYQMVYDKSLVWLGRPETARAGNILAQIWQKYLPYPEFQGQATKQWLERLAPEAPCPSVLILGMGEGIYSILEKHARKIREVRWILFREDCDEVFQNFIEEFYLEHGLPIRYTVIDDVAYFAETGINCHERTTVYDFTGSLYVTIQKMFPGSIWLDIRFSHTKWEQISAFSKGKKEYLEYRSLYKLWTEKQKKYNRPYFLDSTEENRYNTLETVGARGYKSKQES